MPSTDLSDAAQQLAECYAVIYPASPSRSKAMKWLNRARKEISGVKGYLSTEITAAVEELVDARLLQPSITGERGIRARGPCAMPGTVTHFCLAALQRGTAKAILAGMDEELYQPAWMPAPDLPEHLEQHTRLALLNDTFERFVDKDLPRNIWLWLTEPAAKPFLARLPAPHRERACWGGLDTLTHYLQPIDSFAATVEEIAPGVLTHMVLARTRLLQGRFDEARVLIDTLRAEPGIDKPTREECAGLDALSATLQGDDERAVVAIAEALEIEREGTRKRVLHPESTSFTIAVPVLVRHGSTEARARFASLLEARRKLKRTSSLDNWLHAAHGAGQSRASYVPLDIEGQPSWAQVSDAIASRWNRSDHLRIDDPDVIALLERLVRASENGGYFVFVAELQTVLEAAVSSRRRLSEDIRQLFAERSATERHAAMGSRSLIPLVRPIEPWESALRALEELALVARPSATPARNDPANARARLVWQIAVEPCSDIVMATPLEQKLGKNGHWSGGRRVALMRLREQSDTVDYLTEQDRKVCGTIRKLLPSGWHGGSPSYETDERTVFLLAGHPYVIDEEGDPVDVVSVPAELHGVAERLTGEIVNAMPQATCGASDSRDEQLGSRLGVLHPALHGEAAGTPRRPGRGSLDDSAWR